MPVFQKAVTALQGVFDGANRVYSDSNPPQSFLRTEASAPGTPASGQVVEWNPDGRLLWEKDDAGVQRLVGPTILTRDFSKGGVLAVTTNFIDLAMPTGTWRLQELVALLQTVGSTATTVDVFKNGTTIFSTGTKINFAASSLTPTFSAFTNNPTTYIGGTDKLRVAITAAGTSAAGLSVSAFFERTA